jgi:hypothetical protein
MKRAVLYLRVSAIDQTTANQERELREIAGRMRCEVVKVYKDHGISSARGRDRRTAFDALCRDGLFGVSFGCTRDFGNVIEATSIRRSSVRFLRRKIGAGQFGTFSTASVKTRSRLFRAY